MKAIDIDVVMTDCYCSDCGPGRVYTIEKEQLRGLDRKYYYVFSEIKWSTSKPNDPTARKARTLDGVIVYEDVDYRREVSKETYRNFVEDCLHEVLGDSEDAAMGNGSYADQRNGKEFHNEIR
jgi:hypothetical protein